MSHVNELPKLSKFDTDFTPRTPLVASHGSVEVTSAGTPPPILTPPTEILSRIIELGSENDRQGFPILVSHICARLRDVALAHPAMWTSITFTPGKKSYGNIRARLRRSANCPIDITVNKILSPEDAETMLRLFKPHVRRWRGLTLEVGENDTAEIIVQALQSVDEALQLEALSLTGPTPGTAVTPGPISPFNPFGGKTPALRSLFVKNLPLVWESPLFHGLESLQIHHSPSWTNTSLLNDWQKLKSLVIRSDMNQPIVFSFPTQHIVLPELESLELNGVTEEDIIRILSHVELPNLERMLFSHIKDSRNQTFPNVFPLPNMRTLRLHATEMCQDNLLSVLRKVRNLANISFEDSSPIPSFIAELTPTHHTQSDSWITPFLTHFKVIAFERDNAQRMYDDSDIAEALRIMMIARRPAQGDVGMKVKMCVFEGDRDDVTRHAVPWGVERVYRSEKDVEI